jgi:hypothetical protein
MKVKRNSLMCEIYGMIGTWVGIDPIYIKLNGKFNPEGTKIWNGKISIGSKRPQVISVIRNLFNIIYNSICVVNLETLNVHSINLKFNEQYMNLTAPRNVSLGQVIAM